MNHAKANEGYNGKGIEVQSLPWFESSAKQHKINYREMKNPIPTSLPRPLNKTKRSSSKTKHFNQCHAH